MEKVSCCYEKFGDLAMSLCETESPNKIAQLRFKNRKQTISATSVFRSENKRKVEIFPESLENV